MLTYREEIDGLRAIAIVPVVLYHCGFEKYFSGGYVGVDIFFVISGYLITSLIEKEYEKQSFSLINFYERRIRRIFPALILMLIVSCLLAHYFMLPEQLREFGESLISISVFCSNIYFWWKDDGYFSELTQLNPVVHTWSLAVEEQFYFFFPLLYLLLRRRKCFLYLTLFSIGLVSFSLAQFGGNSVGFSSRKRFEFFSQHRYASFYLPFGRFWELLIGAFLAFFEHHIQSEKSKLSPKFYELFSLIGLLLIVTSIYKLNSNNIPPFPNIYTLIPTCGSGLVILFGGKTTKIGTILSKNVFRWIGLISYSVYLWHQPFLAFIRLQINTNINNGTIILLIIPLALVGLFSYYYVEQPFRNKNNFSRKKIFLLGLLSNLVLFLIGLSLIRTGNNRSLIINSQNDTYLFDLKHYGNWQYVVRDFNQIAKHKTFSNRTSNKNGRVALIGDSFAQDFYNMIVEGKYLTNYQIRVYYIFSRCQIYFAPEDRTNFIEVQHRQTCSNQYHIKDALSIIRQSDVILLVSNWYKWSAKAAPITIKSLNLTKQQKVFVLGPKHFGNVNLNLYVNKSKEFRIKQFQYPKQEVIEVNKLLSSVLEKSVFVNVQEMICNGINKTCPLFTPEGKLISHDGAHLTKFGAKYIGNIIFKKKPLNQL